MGNNRVVSSRQWLIAAFIVSLGGPEFKDGIPSPRETIRCFCTSIGHAFSQNETLVFMNNRTHILLHGTIMKQYYVSMKYASQRSHNLSMCWWKIDVIPLLTHWIYVFLALNHRYIAVVLMMGCIYF